MSFCELTESRNEAKHYNVLTEECSSISRKSLLINPPKTRSQKPIIIEIRKLARCNNAIRGTRSDPSRLHGEASKRAVQKVSQTGTKSPQDLPQPAVAWSIQEPTSSATGKVDEAAARRAVCGNLAASKNLSRIVALPRLLSTPPSLSRSSS